MPEAKTETRKPSRLERAAQLRAKAQRLESLDRQQTRKRDTRQKVVIGGAVIAEARENAAFRAQLASIVRTRVIRDIDTEVVTSWLSTT